MSPFPYRLVFFVAALLALGIFAAAIAIPNVFTPGEAIIAEDVNENFAALEAMIASLEAAVSVLETRSQPLIASSASTSVSTVTATTRDFLSVTIDVPGPGVVEVRGEATLVTTVFEGAGLSTTRMFLATTAGDTNVASSDFLTAVPLSVAYQAAKNGTATLLDEVDAAGPYTYFLNADVFAADNLSITQLGSPKLIATYYPAAGGSVAPTTVVHPASPESGSTWTGLLGF